MATANPKVVDLVPQYSPSTGTEHIVRDADGNVLLSINGTTGVVTIGRATKTVNLLGPVMLPVLDGTARDALTAVNGMLIYNSDEAAPQVRMGGSWRTLAIAE
jgi:hypothetical protein